jgi:hypothetical protein
VLRFVIVHVVILLLSQYCGCDIWSAAVSVVLPRLTIDGELHVCVYLVAAVAPFHAMY